MICMKTEELKLDRPRVESEKALKLTSGKLWQLSLNRATLHYRFSNVFMLIQNCIQLAANRVFDKITKHRLGYINDIRIP